MKISQIEKAHFCFDLFAIADSDPIFRHEWPRRAFQANRRNHKQLGAENQRTFPTKPEKN